MVDYDFVGVDIAKAKFDVAYQLDKRWIVARFDNNQNGYEQFIIWLKQHTHLAFVCLEATGCYGEPLAEYLVNHNIQVSVVNPMQIKHYAKSCLTRNKNDRVDAKMIAGYAAQVVPRCFMPRTSTQKLTREAIQLIDTLNEQKFQLQNQLESIRSPLIKQAIDQSIQCIDKQISKLEDEIKNTIATDEGYALDKKNLLTIVGIGDKTANRLIAYLPHVMAFNNAKQLAAYVGVSPRQYQSGQFYGKTRLSKCGNPRLRKALYMPALVAKNNNPHLKAFCKRLEKNGLKPKQIICAVMRKLIHIIFGILKHKQIFNPNLV